MNSRYEPSASRTSWFSVRPSAWRPPGAKRNGALNQDGGEVRKVCGIRITMWSRSDGGGGGGVVVEEGGEGAMAVVVVFLLLKINKNLFGGGALGR